MTALSYHSSILSLIVRETMQLLVFTDFKFKIISGKNGGKVLKQKQQFFKQSPRGVSSKGLKYRKIPVPKSQIKLQIESLQIY